MWGPPWEKALRKRATIKVLSSETSSDTPPLWDIDDTSASWVALLRLQRYRLFYCPRHKAPRSPRIYLLKSRRNAQMTLRVRGQILLQPESPQCWLKCQTTPNPSELTARKPHSVSKSWLISPVRVSLASRNWFVQATTSLWFTSFGFILSFVVAQELKVNFDQKIALDFLLEHKQTRGDELSDVSLRD